MRPRPALGVRPSQRRAARNGSPDNSFTVGTLDSLAYTIALQPDGKIIIGGAFDRVNGVTRDRIARLQANGGLDSTFNAAIVGEVYTTSVRADGKILVGGSFSIVQPRVETHNLARFNPDGSVDSSFSALLSRIVLDHVELSNGKIVVVGSSYFFGEVPSRGIARLQANGSWDSTFRPSPGTEENAVVRALAVQSNGNIVLGGDFKRYNGVIRYASPESSPREV